MIDILSLYNQISAEGKKFFRSKTTLKAYKAGDFLLLDGEVQEQLLLVKKGVLMMYYDNGDDKMQVVDFAYRNRFCADIDSFSGQKASLYNIECISNCEIESITYTRLLEVFDKYPETERAYRIMMERVLAAVLKRYMNLGRLSIQQRFSKLIETRPELFSLVQHKYIASYLNIDHTNFSKLYNNCAKSLKFS